MQKQTLFLLLLLPTLLFSQKKSLEIADVHRWNRIASPMVSPDGQWVAYLLTPTTEGDNTLCLWQAANQKTQRFERAANPRFSHDGHYLVFEIKPSLDTLKAQRRRKVKKDELPKDSLAIYTLATGALEKFPDVRSFVLPEKWSGWLAYQLEPAKPEKPKKEEKAEPDSTQTAAAAETEKKPKKEKKEDAKENGSRLVLRDLTTGWTDTVAFVMEYRFAKRGPALLLHSTGSDSTFPAGVYRFDCTQRQLQPIMQAEKGKFAQLALDDPGRQLAFLADTDTSKAQVRPWQLCYWSETQPKTKVLADTGSAFLRVGQERWTISEYSRPQFSDDGNKLYFGMAPQLPLQDTSLLEEEIVQVEVWAWNNNRLYTEMENRLAADKKRSFPVLCRLDSGNIIPLGSPEIPDWRFQEERNAERALAFTDERYAQYRQWEGEAPRDVYAVDLKTGAKTQLVEGLRCSPYLSPETRFVAWWSDPDSSWFAWDARQNQTHRLTDNRQTTFFNEESDTPDFPNSHGMAGWLKDDAALLVYDRFDIWKLDPAAQVKPQRLTNGREKQLRYRYIQLDPEAQAIDPNAPLLLHTFSEQSKTEGYVWFDLKTGTIQPWLDGTFSYTRRPIKAEKADKLVFTRENYQVFPDLQFVTIPKATPRAAPSPLRISNANPQQADYHWGAIELVKWTSLSGAQLEGLLVKPDNFDPKKQYPMVVNFYEKLSDGLHQHRAPDVHRSSITFTMYASRGYLVFAPDIPYKTGYPGESAYDAIMSGVTALIDKGFVDPKHVGLQGHSWGGYQAAYLITRTNLFACAETGAPVSNMTSAYGGIRWGSGMSRQFQYERTQSRIGGSLWEYPMRYLENSPLFSLDKVQTPVLILHNDEDGAVPWYQGIEMFTGLRRLGKPAWLLNYNGEPHWPVKLQNRIDFQTRLQQFLDHYLLDAPMPRWMDRGVPPIEKGILQGLEPVDAGHD